MCTGAEGNGKSDTEAGAVLKAPGQTPAFWDQHLFKWGSRRAPGLRARWLLDIETVVFSGAENHPELQHGCN